MCNAPAVLSDVAAQSGRAVGIINHAYLWCEREIQMLVSMQCATLDLGCVWLPVLGPATLKLAIILCGWHRVCGWLRLCPVSGMMSADSVSPAELARYVRCNSCVRVLLYSYLRGTICSRLSVVGTLL